MSDEGRGLLLGERADLKSIKGGTDKCVIEARFDIPHGGLEEYFRESDLVYDSEMCIMRRELFASGRSRAFVNDSPVRLEQARIVGGMLIDIHSAPLASARGGGPGPARPQRAAGRRVDRRGVRSARRCRSGERRAPAFEDFYSPRAEIG